MPFLKHKEFLCEFKHEGISNNYPDCFSLLVSLVQLSA